jgi:hypothetical protein
MKGKGMESDNVDRMDRSDTRPGQSRPCRVEAAVREGFHAPAVDINAARSAGGSFVLIPDSPESATAVTEYKRHCRNHASSTLWQITTATARHSVAEN